MRNVTCSMGVSLDDSLLEWAAIWKPLPKGVFSTTLSGWISNSSRPAPSMQESSTSATAWR